MAERIKPNLLPAPRSLKMRAGKFILPKRKPLSAIKVVRTSAAPNNPEGYALAISKNGIEISVPRNRRLARSGGDVAAIAARILAAACRA